MSKIYSYLKEINTTGAFKRTESAFRNFIKADGSTEFAPEKNRYHLYVSLACPWAHRTLIVRRLKGLEDVIGVSVVHYFLSKEKGWEFTEDYPDHLHPEVKALRELYLRSNPDYEGKCTVPVLWDKKNNIIVNNESSEIIRMLNSEFNSFAKNPSLDLYPQEKRKEIDDINAYVYDNVNNGVYKAGFATKQEPYEQAYDALFEALDTLESKLDKQRYLVGDQFTEADVRLFTTLLRFDPVYHNHFKCNKKKIMEYNNLFQYLKEIYQMPGVKETVDMFHIKYHYYTSHLSINPSQVVPKGPIMDLDSPHNRDKN